MLKEQRPIIAVVGLGYVGLPLAVAFARAAFQVIAYDIHEGRISELKNGLDSTDSVDASILHQDNLHYTTDHNYLAKASIYIIAVPTPVDLLNQPDFSALIAASQMVGRYLKKGDIVVYESTVYPGATEEVILPYLERYSGLKCPLDFGLGYSPERINPGDKRHNLENVRKLVSASTEAVCQQLVALYGLIVKAGVTAVSSIRVAEAAKMVENIQRDVNIALMNEFSMIFDALHINFQEVLKACKTKWNFLAFEPGLVGGHCIGVDPYYLQAKAKSIRQEVPLTTLARDINESMGFWVAHKVIDSLKQKSIALHRARVGILGVTFKENCKDLRNSKVVDIIRTLAEYKIEVLVVDPLADRQKTKEDYGIDLFLKEDLKEIDVLIVAVAHDVFKEIGRDEAFAFFRGKPVLFDLKNIYSKSIFSPHEALSWSL